MSTQPQVYIEKGGKCYIDGHHQWRKDLFPTYKGAMNELTLNWVAIL